MDKVFLYAVTRNIEPFLAAALANGKPHMVVLSAIACAMPDAMTAPSPSAQRHFAVQRPIEAAGLPFTFLRPSDFAIMPIAVNDWMPSIKKSRAASMCYPDRRMAPIHELDIADCACAALTQVGHVGAKLSMTGPASLSPRQQIETISAVLGEPIELTELTPEGDRERLNHILKDGRVDSRLEEFERRTRLPYPVTDTVERVTGHPARSYAEWVRDHIDSFQ